MKIIGYGKLNEEDLIKFQNEINFELPDDYKNFLINFNGGVPEERYSTFMVDSINQEIGLQVLYGLNLEDGLDLREWYDEYQDDLLPNCIMIGHGLGFGFIILMNSPEKSGVYFWDNTFELGESSEDENVYKISDTFKKFLDKVKKS